MTSLAEPGRAACYRARRSPVTRTARHNADSTRVLSRWIGSAVCSRSSSYGRSGQGFSTGAKPVSELHGSNYQLAGGRGVQRTGMWIAPAAVVVLLVRGPHVRPGYPYLPRLRRCGGPGDMPARAGTGRGGCEAVTWSWDAQRGRAPRLAPAPKSGRTRRRCGRLRRPSVQQNGRLGRLPRAAWRRLGGPRQLDETQPTSPGQLGFVASRVALLPRGGKSVVRRPSGHHDETEYGCPAQVMLRMWRASRSASRSGGWAGGG
jgi:hypothetical protein